MRYVLGAINHDTESIFGAINHNLILIFPWLGPLASDMDATRHEALRRRHGELYIE